MDDRFELETVADRLKVPIDPLAAERLLSFVALLRKWQPAQNLVARDTLDHVWTRHIADCLQLLALLDAHAGSLMPDRLPKEEKGPFVDPSFHGQFATVNNSGLDAPQVDDRHMVTLSPNGRNVLPLRIVDLGSGAGFPGLVLALMRPRLFDVTLVEANGRKAAFLRTVSRETAASINVLQSRIEAISDSDRPHADVVTARALASLEQLMAFAEPWIVSGASAFLHKGGEYARELAEWPDATAHTVIQHVSGVDSNGRILEIRRAAS